MDPPGFRPPNSQEIPINHPKEPESKPLSLSTKIFQAQIVEKSQEIGSLLKKEEEITPTGQFFCTHTIKKRDMRKPITLDTHTIVQGKLNTVVANQVTRKLGEKWLQECVSAKPSPSYSLTGNQENQKNLLPVVLQNEGCKTICEQFASTKSNINQLKREIKFNQNTLENLNKPTYTALVSEQDFLKGVNDTQSGLNLLFDNYQKLVVMIQELGSHPTEDQFKNVINKIDELMKAIKELGQKNLSIFNKSTFLKTNPINFGGLKINDIRRLVEKLSKNQFSTKEEAQSAIKESIAAVTTEFESLTNKFVKLADYKKGVDVQLEQKMPIYIRMQQDAKRLFNEKKPMKNEHSLFLKDMAAALDPKTARSIQAQIEALNNLKVEVQTTNKNINELINRLESEVRGGRENEVVKSETYDLLIEQVEFLFSLLALTDQSSNPFDIKGIVQTIEGFKNLEKQQLQGNIGPFRSKIKEFNKPINEQRIKIEKNVQTFTQGLPTKEKLQEFLQKAEEELLILKQKKAELIQVFLKEIVQIEGGQLVKERLDGAIHEAQGLVMGLLQEYQLHSQDRFTKLLEGHFNFVKRLNFLLGNLTPETAGEIRKNLKEFLIAQSKKEFASSPLIKRNIKELILYREMQGMHADKQGVECCKTIQTLVLQQFRLIFGNKITEKHFSGKASEESGMQAAHVVPFSGLFSWHSDVFVHYLFGSTISPMKDPKKVADDIQKLVPSIQKEGVATETEIKSELILRSEGLSHEEASSLEKLNQEYKQFVFEALIFLSRISSLEMSGTEHFPQWFNQEIDFLTEEKLTIEFPESYKILLGNALMELIDMKAVSIAPSHIQYLTNTLTILETRIEELVKKMEPLTTLELLECHTIVSLFAGIEALKIEDLKLKKIQILFQQLEEKINSNSF